MIIPKPFGSFLDILLKLRLLSYDVSVPNRPNLGEMILQRSDVGFDGIKETVAKVILFKMYIFSCILFWYCALGAPSSTCHIEFS